jgi:hypothetical protein
MTTKMLQAVYVVAVCGALMIAACKITKHEDGSDKQVTIDAPGASVHVDTKSATNDTGIPLYPGAQAKPSSGDEKGGAHVDLKMPFLKVKVVALKFTSDDPPEKLLAFYRDRLDSYGKVIECKGKGQDVELGSGRGFDSPVTCSKESGHAGEVSLKTGTEGNQHVVAVKPNGTGSNFELIYIHVGNKNEDDYHGKQPS